MTGQAWGALILIAFVAACCMLNSMRRSQPSARSSTKARSDISNPDSPMWAQDVPYAECFEEDDL